MVNGSSRRILIVSNLVTIAVTACAVLFALLHNNNQDTGIAARLLQEVEECCDCTTGLPTPTSAPEPPPPSFGCFAATSTVQVLQDDGVIHSTSLEHVKIGDLVLVDNNDDDDASSTSSSVGTYEPIYSFGHYSLFSKSNDFVHLSVTIIENNNKNNNKFMKKQQQQSLKVLKLTSNHMVFVNNNNNNNNNNNAYIAAANVQVGDYLIYGNNQQQQRVKVESVTVGHTERGLFAPFTPSGTIVVDGFLVSNFVQLLAQQQQQQQQDTTPLFSLDHQWLAHSFEFPHRLFCHYWKSCPDETYNDHGISNWVALPLKASQWFLEQQQHNTAATGWIIIIKGGLLTIFCVILILFNIIETVCFQQYSAMTTTALLLVGGGIYYFYYYYRINHHHHHPRGAATRTAGSRKEVYN